MTVEHNSAARRDESRFARLVKKWVLRDVTLQRKQQLSRDFVLLEFSVNYRNPIAWVPGDQVQLSLGPGFIARTFTPTHWNSQTQSFQILIYLHNQGPGCHWAANSAVGMQSSMFGPRKSIRAPEADGPLLLIGDESCFGLAVAMQRQGLRCLFEVGQVEACQTVLDQMGVQHGTLIRRETEDGHWRQMEKEILKLDADGSHYLLAGKASSIQRSLRWLKIHGVSNQRIHSKAYWAPGKTGLD